MSLHINIKRIKNIAAVICITAAFYSCENKEQQAKIENQEKLFDLPSFFQKEIDSLAALNPDVNKTVKKR
jgi:hypothetical protein